MATAMKPGSLQDRQLSLVERARRAGETPRVVSPRRPVGGGSVVDATQAAGTLAEMAKGLPSLLMELSSELLAHQKADRLQVASDAGSDHPSVETAVGVARLALAEATTAAQILSRRLNDTARVLAVLADTVNGS